MAPTVEADLMLPPVRDLSPEESQAFFDEKAQTLLGISGAEFVRRYHAGDYDAILDDPEHSDLMYMAMFLPRDR